jgi:hypothetical protein
MPALPQHRSISQQANVLVARALELSETPRARCQLLLKRLSDHPLVHNPDLLLPPEQVVRENLDRGQSCWMRAQPSGLC